MHPIETADATARLLPALIKTADGMYRKGPGSIVPHVYCGGGIVQLLRIPVTIDNADITVTLPDEFVEVLNELPS